MANVKLRKRPCVMIIRDGWGFNPDPAEDKFNAVKQARVPVDDMLMAQYPNCLIRTCGEDVGLPEGTMGNSEVGHQNIGAGRADPFYVRQLFWQGREWGVSQPALRVGPIELLVSC